MLLPDDSEFSPQLLAVVVLLAIAFLGLMMFLVSRVIGWSRLAEDYRSFEEMPSTRFRMRSALLRGWAHYGNCITFGLDARGLHLASFGSLLGHPRLLIPWADVSIIRKKVWWARFAELRFRRAPEIPILISARLAEKISSSAASRCHTGSALLEHTSAQIPT